jgi:hypothetical protein
LTLTILYIKWVLLLPSIKKPVREKACKFIFSFLFLSSLIATDTAYARGRIGEKALRDALKGASHTSMRRKE